MGAGMGTGIRDITNISWKLDLLLKNKAKEGILSIIGWSLIFGSLLYLSPCHGYDYSDGVKNYSEMSFDPRSIFPLGFGTYGIILVIRKGFKLLRSFEAAE